MNACSELLASDMFELNSLQDLYRIPGFIGKNFTITRVPLLTIAMVPPLAYRKGPP